MKMKQSEPLPQPPAPAPPLQPLKETGGNGSTTTTPAAAAVTKQPPVPTATAAPAAAPTGENSEEKKQLERKNSKSKIERKNSKGKSSKWRRAPLPSKKKISNGFMLSKDDVYYLKQHTRYDEKEIREWYRGFRQDCPDGQLSKKVIVDMCNQILPGGDSTTFVDQIFRIFDKDNNGTIDFKEFMLATDMTSSGSPEEKLEWAFKMYDKDGSGTIELTEMVEVIGTLYDMEGVTTSGGEGNEQRATRIFAELDINGDGELTMDEFVRGCMQEKDLVRMLSAGGLHADEAEADDHL